MNLELTEVTQVPDIPMAFVLKANRDNHFIIKQFKAVEDSVPYAKCYLMYTQSPDNDELLAYKEGKLFKKFTGPWEQVSMITFILTNINK